MKAILFLLSVVVQQMVYCQKNDTLRKYLDANFSLTSRKNMIYPAIAFKSGDHWILFATYPNKNPLLNASFRDKKLTTLEGSYILYYSNKNKATEGRYENGYKTGIWKVWHVNGQLRDSGIIKNNQLVGTWNTWYENGKLLLLIDYASDVYLASPDRYSKPASTPTNLVTTDADLVGYKHGNFLRYYSKGTMNDSGQYIGDKKSGLWKIWFPNGQMEAMGNFSNDSLQGEWIWYRENGIVATKENYRDNKLVSLQCFDELGNSTGEYCSILKPPVPLGKFSDFENYMLDNIILPVELRNVRLEGTVTINCTITKEGKLTAIDIKGCPYESLKIEIEKFFRGIKEWSPAIIHNRETDYSFEYVLPLSMPAVNY